MTRLDGRTFVADRAEDVEDPEHTLVPGSVLTLTFEDGRVMGTAGADASATPRPVADGCNDTPRRAAAKGHNCGLL